jgi:hypothetical protein
MVIKVSEKSQYLDLTASSFGLFRSFEPRGYSKTPGATLDSHRIRVMSGKQSPESSLEADSGDSHGAGTKKIKT